MRTLDLTVLQCVRDGHSSAVFIRRTLTKGLHSAAQSAGTVNIDRAITRLVERGDLSRTRGGKLSITTQGRARLPALTLPAIRPYVPPPPPPRRAGSMDYYALPSVAAGVRRYGEVIG